MEAEKRKAKGETDQVGEGQSKSREGRKGKWKRENGMKRKRSAVSPPGRGRYPSEAVPVHVLIFLACCLHIHLPPWLGGKGNSLCRSPRWLTVASPGDAQEQEP